MPLTPRSRVFEDKLAHTRKKYESRNAFASERARKATESFSSPPARVNANLRGANFMQGGGAGKAVEAFVDWDTLKSAAREPMSTAKGFGKIALMTQNPALASRVLGPKEMLAAMLMQDSDVNKASAVGGILPMGSLERLGARGASKAMYAFSPDVMHFGDDVTEGLIDYVSKQARKLGEGYRPKTPIETPRNVTAFKPSEKTDSGFWMPVERDAIDPISGLPSFDPSEIRSAAFGGVGDLVVGTPLENLDTLAIANKAHKIRAVYEPPSAKEILGMMRRTDSAVPGRLKVKRDNLEKKLSSAQKDNNIDEVLRLQEELDNTLKPKDWVPNTYSIEDANMLRSRWLEASKHFEDTYGEPLPWRLEADYVDEFGKTKTKRIFGQDVEHSVPVNRGGKGTIDELTLLPTIPNTGKRDYSWEDYSAKYPEGWSKLIDVMYGASKKY